MVFCIKTEGVFTHKFNLTYVPPVFSSSILYWPIHSGVQQMLHLLLCANPQQSLRSTLECRRKSMSAWKIYKYSQIYLTFMLKFCLYISSSIFLSHCSVSSFDSLSHSRMWNESYLVKTRNWNISNNNTIKIHEESIFLWIFGMAGRAVRCVFRALPFVTKWNAKWELVMSLFQQYFECVFKVLALQ